MSSERPSMRDRMRSMTSEPGVYLMKDRLGNTIYVGKAKNLKKRLSSYFMPSRKSKADLKTLTLIESIWDFDIQTVRSEEEALILESKLIKQYRPRYNVSLRDDKRFWLVRVQLKDTMPKFDLTRLRKEDGARYFGPFVHSNALKATLEWLNREFGLRTCAVRSPGEYDHKHCHADVIRNCSAPCVGKVSLEGYREKVMEAVEFLEGRGKRARFNHLNEEMQAAAANLDFEKAASLRDVIQNLEKTLSPTRQFSRRQHVPSTVQPKEDMTSLGEYLGLDRAPRVMECFDISNVSNTHIVASMVRFQDGAPDNQKYRRYRMKSVESQDDFASMAEVVRRRYSRILMEARKQDPEAFEVNQESTVQIMYRLGDAGKLGTLLPDLVIVDGGKGQLSSAYAELKDLGMSDLPIIGLAKQEEEIFFPGESESLRISHDEGALKLMQRIRDEAHRFANNYNELLLRKRMHESVLDEVPGMSKSRKLALFQHFKSLAAIKKATVRELQAVPGVGPKSAEQIVDWFSRQA
ncbi:excinuclease ABC subunit UvrC [Rubritalea marina]|uniref:excinuclease ABC subunit UvrC n=1 Tax=Rubritalea marina TaxID=361055 RepID=UPI00047616A3|nr:excinuclease ABC subunit UvrC [Rubritalea marina]